MVLHVICGEFYIDRFVVILSLSPFYFVFKPNVRTYKKI